MHILLIHQAFVALDEPGGTRHVELARFLVENGHQVTVIASPISYLTGSGRGAERRPWIERQQDGNLTILRAYTYPALHRSFVHRIFSFLSFMVSSFLAGLRVRKVDAVWGTSPPIFQGLTAWALARLKGAAFLFEVRDLWPAFAIQVGVLRQPLLIRLSEGLERFLYRHADQMVVNSPGFIQHVQERGALRVQLVPNGADPHMFDPAANGSAYRQAHRLEGKYVIMYAGAHGMSNDLAVVLQAAKLLHHRPQIAFVFVGDGKEKAALQAQANQMELDNVYFLPPLPKNQMGEALAAADACLAILKPIPLYATVYPNKVFDYMAAGKPVILAIEGVIRQAVEEAQAGLPVLPGDPEALAEAAEHLASYPEIGRTLGANGRRYIETHFDRAALAGQMERIFKELLAQRGKHPQPPAAGPQKEL